MDAVAAGEFSTVLSGEEDRDAFGVEDSDPPADGLEFEDVFELLDLAEEGFELLDLAEEGFDESDLADEALELVFESLSLSSFPGTLRESFTLSDALDFAEELLDEALEATSFLAEASTEPEGEGDLEALRESFPDEFDSPDAADCADLADEALEDC